MKILVTAFLLCCFTFTIFPFHFLHGHVFTEHECEPANPVFENDPCHIKAFHPDKNTEACDHSQHLGSRHYSCDICKLVSAAGPLFFHVKECRPKPDLTDNKLILTDEQLAFNVYLPVLFNKGPPALV